MTDDIVARLRADARWFGNVPKHNKVHIDADKVPRFAAKMMEAADEIERLRRIYSEAEKDHTEYVAKYYNATIEIERLRAERDGYLHGNRQTLAALAEANEIAKKYKAERDQARKSACDCSKEIQP